MSAPFGSLPGSQPRTDWASVIAFLLGFGLCVWAFGWAFGWAGGFGLASLAWYTRD